MRQMLAAFGIGLAATSAAPAQDFSPSRSVRYVGLVEAVRAAEGDIVLVDFWFDRCLPCKREFPKLVALQRKYDADGLHAIAVNLDDPADAETADRVEEFLKSQGSGCRHLTLDEPVETWQPRLKIETLPCVFLFDRRGRLLSRWEGDEVDYGSIERRVARALRE